MFNSRMEAKLKEYRARRRRQEFIEKTTEKLENTKRHFIDLFKKMITINVDDAEMEVAPALKEIPQKDPAKKKTHLEADYDEENKNKNDIKEEQNLIDMDSETNEEDILDEKPPKSWNYCVIKWAFYVLIWLTLYIYFITLQYGAVFFAMSLLVGIYLNTGTRPKKRGEASAYSVFNENCESIDGTLTAEKLQREMFFGSFKLF